MGAIEGAVVRTSGFGQHPKACWKYRFPDSAQVPAEGPGSQDSVLTRSQGNSFMRTSALPLLRISPNYWKCLVSMEGSYAVGTPW